MSTILIERKYKLLKKIGEGGFGNIYKGININTQKKVAIKIDTQNNIILCNEAKIYKLLQNQFGFPAMRAYGKAGIYYYLVIDLFDYSIEKFSRLNNKNFGIIQFKNVFMQMLNRIEVLHSNNIIHRDIKPENFVYEKNTGYVYLIDFGISKMFMIDNKHISLENNKNLTGSERYASIHIHNGANSSRRDDLISISYVIGYIILGHLPWQNKKEKLKEKINYQNSCKSLISNNYYKFLSYCENLDFYDKPNYEYLYNLLQNIS
ncbi:protein kinase [bacterium]|nr:protein kinase [bacterium]